MSKNEEIERKFLVSKEFAESLIGGNFDRIRQFYLTEGYNPTVRIRTKNFSQGYITIKGKAEKAKSPEFEYPIPYDDAVEMEETLPHTDIVYKHRYGVTYEDGKEWEVDIFWDDNNGLYLAEIELTSQDEEFIKPWWCGEEVTEDRRFSNINLALNPVKNWTTIERAELIF